MSVPGPDDLDDLQNRLRQQALAGQLRLTTHAHQEMVEEAISLDEALEAIEAGRILENYAEHRRGACCLVHGKTAKGRHLHIVCTTSLPTLIIITVYEPKLPKWTTPTRRRASP